MCGCLTDLCLSRGRKPCTVDHTMSRAAPLQAVDMVVAQHAVAKVSGTTDGFTLVTGVLSPQDHPTLALANCALHILRVARQVTLPPLESWVSNDGGALVHAYAARASALGPPRLRRTSRDDSIGGVA